MSHAEQKLWLESDDSVDIVFFFFLLQDSDESPSMEKWLAAPGWPFKGFLPSVHYLLM